MGLVCVVIPIHYNHGHPLVCYQYHHGLVFFKLPDCLVFLWTDVGFGRGAAFLEYVAGFFPKLLCFLRGKSGTSFFYGCNV